MGAGHSSELKTYLQRAITQQDYADSSEGIKKRQELFGLMDKNKDHQIDKREIPAMWKHFEVAHKKLVKELDVESKLTRESFYEMLSYYDAEGNDDGNIDYPEFSQLAPQAMARKTILRNSLRVVYGNFRFMCHRATTDICDEYEDSVRYASANPKMFDFGGKKRFEGVVATVQCLEDNSMVKEAVAEHGNGRVLVIDAGGSMQRAVVGDMIAAKALSNGWKGFVVHGCIRDSVEISKLDIGLKAMGTHPRKTEKRNIGIRDISVSFSSVTFNSGDYIIVDEDGVVVGDKKLLSKEK